MKRIKIRLIHLLFIEYHLHHQLYLLVNKQHHKRKEKDILLLMLGEILID
jgi:hypothetical protein